MNRRTDSRHPTAAPSRHRAPGSAFRPLETVVLFHVGSLLLLASWAFGGGASWARFLLTCWGSLSVLITAAAIRRRARRDESLRQPLLWLVPFAAFNVLVLLSCLNPSFSERVFAGQLLLAHTGADHPGLPSTAHAATSREHLWLFDAIYLSCFNLVLAIRRRQALRTLLLVGVGNAVLLSILGTFQKLTSDGLFFGRVPTPNPRFFSTFVYGNHWAAYILLLIAACLGLLFYFTRRAPEGHFIRSPVAMGLIAVLLMAITPLLAGSRAGTVLVLVLLSAALVQVLRNLRSARQNSERSHVLPAAGLILGVVLALGGGLYLGRSAVQERWHDTEGQWQSGLLNERFKLYSDSWHLAAEQPWFGWGFGSFDKVFQLTRPRPLEPNRQYEHSYLDAHSDWLQSLVEVGFVGTALLIMLVVGPLVSSHKLRYASALPAYLLGGCGLILLYAAVEFPFANPAVMIAFWISFFSAIQYVRLSARIAQRGP